MSASDGPELIKPQVKPAAAQHVPTKEELEAEKRRRIDEALNKYTASLNIPGVIAPEKAAEKPEAHPKKEQQHPAPEPEQSGAQKPAPEHTEAEKPAPKTEEPKNHEAAARKADAQFVQAHLEEVREIVDRMMSRGQPKPADEHPETRGEMIAPTTVDPEASIALAVKELRERKEAEAKQAALDAEEQKRPTNRYRSDPGEHFMPAVRNRRVLIKLAVAWLAAIPLALLLNLGVTALGDSVFASLLFVIVWVFGAYGALGWIPLMVSYIRNNM